MKNIEKITNSFCCLGVPGSIADVLSYFLFKHKENFLPLLQQYSNEVAFSLNDTSIMLHNRHPDFGACVEILNPYAEYEFLIVAEKSFNLMIENILVDNDFKELEYVSKKSLDRSDYLESKENW